MRKRSLYLMILIGLVVSLIFSKTIIPNWYYKAGIDAYKNGDYKQAVSELHSALSYNPNNKEARYYYITALLKIPATVKIQRQVYDFSMENYDDSADLLADNQVLAWRNAVMRNSGENYIEQAVYNKGILRWDDSSFPLKVMMKNSQNMHLPPYFESEIKRAFLMWQKTIDVMSFVYTDKQSEANIIIDFQPSTAAETCKKGGDCKYVVAFTSPTIRGSVLKRMTITFYDKDNLGNYFAQRDIFNTALHEIGHAMGVMGHSYNKDDLMYMASNVDVDFGMKRSEFLSISQNDKNTFRLLYKLIPDYTDKIGNYSRKIYAPIVLGDSNKINSTKLLEAQNYIKKAPNLPNGYIDLANAYEDQKDYANALDALNTAMSKSNDETSRGIVYYNMAIVYMNVQEWDKALDCANKSGSGNFSDGEVKNLISIINHNRHSHGFLKRTYGEKFEADKTNVDAAVNLANLYLRELNFIQAGKTLNELINASPKAENDSRVKPYRLLINFFK